MTTITIQHDGNAYTGRLIVEGKRKLSFKVCYRGMEATDGKIYRPDQIDQLKAFAEQILREMVTGRSQMQPCHENGG